MASCSSLLFLPNFRLNCDQRPNLKVGAQSSGDNGKVTLAFSGSVKPVNGSVSLVSSEGAKGSDVLVDEANGKVKSERKFVRDEAFSEIELSWDDGYGSSSVKDYFAGAKELVKHDGGPPRWFSPVDCGQPIKDAPTLLFLPVLGAATRRIHREAESKGIQLPVKFPLRVQRRL